MGRIGNHCANPFLLQYLQFRQDIGLSRSQKVLIRFRDGRVPMKARPVLAAQKELITVHGEFMPELVKMIQALRVTLHPGCVLTHDIAQSALIETKIKIGSLNSSH